MKTFVERLKGSSMSAQRNLTAFLKPSFHMFRDIAVRETLVLHYWSMYEFNLGGRTLESLPTCVLVHWFQTY